MRDVARCGNVSRASGRRDGARLSPNSPAVWSRNMRQTTAGALDFLSSWTIVTYLDQGRRPGELASAVLRPNLRDVNKTMAGGVVLLKNRLSSRRRTRRRHIAASRPGSARVCHRKMKPGELLLVRATSRIGPVICRIWRRASRN